ncbi:MAG TPA: hypothetical protein VMW83_11460 [Spirochaetia bacterium]|nr:hypothetical protein [Spirochaetia bacterium]
MKNRSLPFDPDNDDEVAAWFANNSTAELAGESVKVTVDPEATGLQTITLRLDPQDMDRLKMMAAKAGIGYTTMARILLQRGLQIPPGIAT